MMLRSLVLSSLAVLSVGVHSAAIAGEPEVRGTASTSFAGSSTLHEFEGSVADLTFSVQPMSNAMWAAEVEVPISAMTTENRWRDGNMRAMFHSEEFPTIRAVFSDIAPDEVRTSGRLPFQLMIAGATRDVIAAVSGWEQGTDRIAFDANFTISLDAFGLKAPSTFLMTVDDAVRVSTHVILTRR